MSVYPSGIDSFSNKVDNVDTIYAADINVLQSGITAIQTTVGTSSAYHFVKVPTTSGVDNLGSSSNPFNILYVSAINGSPVNFAPINVAYEQFSFSGLGINTTYTFSPSHTPANNLAINQAYVWSSNDNIVVPQPNFIFIGTMDHVIAMSGFGVYISGPNIYCTDLSNRGPILQNGTPYILVVSYLY